jgi:succinyl-CoA synthetase beta subunit
MKLYEHQARELFRAAGIPVPPGETSESPEQALRAAQRLGLPVMIKAQVLVGGRGKAGGVKMARTEAEVTARAREILALRIKQVPVRRVLVSKAVDIRREYYLGLTVDRSAKKNVAIVSASGGVDIEELASRQPEAILTQHIDPQSGPDQAALARLLEQVFPGPQAAEALQTVLTVYALFLAKDASLVEINPYAELPDGSLVAADAKVVLDDNGLARHPELERFRNEEEYSPEETAARAAGLSFVSLEGDIGCIVNGAGLAMATMDQIKLFGGSPANFLDVGGSSSPEKVLTALAILRGNPRLKAILINIFGGITRCDDIARGILIARRQADLRVPLVIRLIGTNQEQGAALLAGEGITALEDMTEAVKKVLEVSRRVRR